MCGGISYQGQTIYFPQPGAVLPLVRKQYADDLVIGGRREREEGSLPQTGWARLESIKAGKWDKYHPQPVKIHVESFMEKDSSGKPHWYGIKQGIFIQGALVHWSKETRVFVVTVPSVGSLATIHDRWPRLVGDEGKIQEFYDYWSK